MRDTQIRAQTVYLKLDKGLGEEVARKQQEESLFQASMIKG